MKVLGIAGSLRSGSHNRKLLLAAGELLPDGAELEVWDGLKAVPPYDEDDDAEVPPAAVRELRAAIAGADAVLFATPEYNSSVPGQLKNAIDWASRPLATNPLRNKPVAVIGASTGRGGTRRAQQQVRDALLYPGAIVLEEPEVAVPVAWEHFDEDGRLVDEKTRDSIRALLEGLAAAPRAQQRAEAA